MRWLFRSENGTAMIEFALLTPMLCLVLAGLGDLGYAAYESLEVQAAAEAGAEYASANGWNVSGIQTAVTSGTGMSGITASPAPSEFCACPSGAALTPVSCSTTCGGYPAGTYALVSAQIQHWNLLPYPGISSPVTISAQARRRLQ